MTKADLCVCVTDVRLQPITDVAIKSRSEALCMKRHAWSPSSTHGNYKTVAAAFPIGRLSLDIGVARVDLKPFLHQGLQFIPLLAEHSIGFQKAPSDETDRFTHASSVSRVGNSLPALDVRNRVALKIILLAPRARGASFQIINLHSNPVSPVARRRSRLLNFRQVGDIAHCCRSRRRLPPGRFVRRCEPTQGTFELRP
jgi:hypothetical protein